MDKDWKSKVRKKAKGGSSTTGKSKGLVPAPGVKSLAKRSRSYKDRDYAPWAARTRSLNKGDTRTN